MCAKIIVLGLTIIDAIFFGFLNATQSIKLWQESLNAETTGPIFGISYPSYVLGVSLLSSVAFGLVLELIIERFVRAQAGYLPLEWESARDEALRLLLISAAVALILAVPYCFAISSAVIQPLYDPIARGGIIGVFCGLGFFQWGLLGAVDGFLLWRHQKQLIVRGKTNV